jgi:glycosyltransferase involved in cell wall biosynthesis
VRWVIVSDDWPAQVGGVATFGAAIAGELAQRGHEVRVLCRHRDDLEVPAGVRVTGVRGPSFGRRGPWWLALRGLRAIHRADVVLATTWQVASRVRHSRPARLQILAHGSDVTRAPSRERTFARTWAAANDRWAVSAYLAGRLDQRGVHAEVLPAPVDLAPWPVPVGAGGCWGFVGRATRLKAGDRFVRWVAEAGVRGVVVGDGPALAGWQELARRLGATVQFTGALPRSDVRQLLHTLDLLVLCPRLDDDGGGAEGLGLVAIEAAAVGVPAVGCDTGGVREALGPGLCVADPDDAAASVRQIRRWWHPARGRDAWAWCRATHGVRRTVDRLEAASDR